MDVATTANLRGLSAVNAKVVWASGSGGTVIRTSDGGKTWSVMIVPGAQQLDFRGIRAFDKNTAVILSSGPAEKGLARIYRTIDGGKSWQQVFEQKRIGIFFDAVAFWDRHHGIVLSDPVDGKFALFVTDDGGLTWKQVSPAAMPAALPKEGAFAASNSCLAVQGERNVWFATGGANVARVFHSSDRGKTWSVAETPVHPTNESSGVFSLAFLNSKSGIAVGGDYAHPLSSDLANFLYTTDGGKTWITGIATDPPGVYLSSVAIAVQAGMECLLVAGTGGSLMSPARVRWYRVGDLSLNSLAALGGDSVIAWAVGPNGIVAHIRLLFKPA